MSRAYYAGPLWLYLLQANERFASNRGRTDALHAAFLADAAARCAECAPSASAPVVPKAAAVALHSALCVTTSVLTATDRDRTTATSSGSGRTQSAGRHTAVLGKGTSPLADALAKSVGTPFEMRAARNTVSPA